LLRDVVESPSVDLELFEVQPERTSLIARYGGTDPEAPALCLMGHTDVVPVSSDGWSVDPFGGELIDGEVWGRGAVDMLNLTSSMAVAFREIVRSGRRYPGDIVYLAVADEEAGGALGAGHLVRHEWDALRCDYVLTEYGGSPTSDADNTLVLLTTAEKRIGARKIVVRGSPGHGSMPYRTDNAMVKAAAIVTRIAEYDPGARLEELFALRVRALGLSDELQEKLLDPARLRDALTELRIDLGRNLHSCCHTTFTPTILTSGAKSNTVPDRAELIVDVRLLPGDSQDDVDEHLRAAIGDDLWPSVTVTRLFSDEVVGSSRASSSSTDTRLWSALGEAISMAKPGASIVPSMVTGATDARYFRDRGVTAYGAGLLSPGLPLGDFLTRFHGNDERIDVESLRLTTQLWLDVFDRLWV
jgi:acetylornithine deacetylase/succinyl-diaminopimelate desuccinylase-like protein